MHSVINVFLKGSPARLLAVRALLFSLAAFDMEWAIRSAIRRSVERTPFSPPQKRKEPFFPCFSVSPLPDSPAANLHTLQFKNAFSHYLLKTEDVVQLQ